MALTPADEKAFTTIANNPKLRAQMLEGLAEVGFKDHPAVKEHLDFESRLSTHLKPLEEKNAELQKRLDERERVEIYTRQRDSVRKGPFGFNDEKIAKLEERISKSGVSFPAVDEAGRTFYQNAAMYFQNQDNGMSESTFPVMDFTGPSRKTETWRDLLNETDKSKNPLYMNRRERRRVTDKLYDEAKADWMAEHQK
jgi:hypothetical protein